MQNARLAAVGAIGRLTNWQWTREPKLEREALGLQFRGDSFSFEKKSVERFQGDDNLGITSELPAKGGGEREERGEERRGKKPREVDKQLQQKKEPDRRAGQQPCGIAIITVPHSTPSGSRSA